MRNTFDAVKFSITCKVWRNMNGINSRDMAEMCGIATSTYGFIETGDRTPTIAELSHLCDLMAFEVKEFFTTSGKV